MIPCHNAAQNPAGFTPGPLYLESVSAAERTLGMVPGSLHEDQIHPQRTDAQPRGGCLARVLHSWHRLKTSVLAATCPEWLVNLEVEHRV